MATETTWLIILSIVALAQILAVVLLWVKLGSLPSIRELDLADKMDRILHIANSNVAIKNETIRRHLAILLDSIEAHPIAAEQFYVQVQSLRNALAA